MSFLSYYLVLSIIYFCVYSFEKSLAILTGTPGGWPLSMFLDENGVPFSGGTYFPPKEAYGRASFISILNQVSDFYGKNREKVKNILKHQKGGLSGKPLEEEANKLISKFYKLLKDKIKIIGVGGVDSYDIDATVDGRGSKGACHLYTKFNMEAPPNTFVAEYASRPPLAKIFYEDVLMAAFFYGFSLLIENNKYGIVRYFESRGYDGYLMERPEHLGGSTSKVSVKTKGIPSNSQDVIQAHAQSIEAYIHNHVGYNESTGEYGKMYMDKTLEDWIGYKIDNRTKFDLTISSGLALLAAQKTKIKERSTDFSEKKFLRRYKDTIR